MFHYLQKVNISEHILFSVNLLHYFVHSEEVIKIKPETNSKKHLMFYNQIKFYI